MQIRSVIVAAFTAGMALVPMSAKAVCMIGIYAERSQANGAGMVTRVSGRVAIDDPFYYYADTTDVDFKGMIAAAVAQHSTLLIVGNAGACPTTPATGPRPVGNILQLNLGASTCGLAC
jgi:hypothetical protein